MADNTEHSDPDSYSWCLLRLATVRAAQTVVKRFLEIAGVEFQGKDKGITYTLFVCVIHVDY